VFPRATSVESETDASQQPAAIEPSLANSCSKLERHGIVINPSRGGAVLWHNLMAVSASNTSLQSEEEKDRDPDRLAVHGSCPVSSGEKWVMQFWIRTGPV
jgi:hypothetical protein